MPAPLRIAILTLGTRGDVQPYVALAKALKARGHRVTLAAPENFEGWVTGHGVAFHPVGFDMEAFLQSDQVRAAVDGNKLRLLGLLRNTVIPMFRAMLDGAWAAAKDADIILYHPKMFAAVDVAEATGAKAILASPIPVLPTAEFPSIVSGGDYGPWLNRLSWRMFMLARVPYRRVLNDWRARVLDLGKGRAFAPVAAGSVMQLCAISPAIVPRPGDWPKTAHMTGIWTLEDGADWQPDPALARFLAAGAAPVYIGFGSMTSRDPGALARKVIAGVDRAGVRAVLATGWGGIETGAVPDSVHVIDGAPHAALFPLMCAVVHHGGAGTTAAGLRAGRPTLICPQSVDQPFWGGRVARLGCGPAPLPLRRLDADAFAGRLRALVSTEAFAARAARIGAAMALEDGPGTAVTLVERAAASFGGEPVTDA